MTISSAGPRFISLASWLFFGLGVYLVLETGPFWLLEFALKKTTAELAGPYFACAMPVAIFMPLVWLLRRREDRGVPAKRLAREWGASVAFFGVVIVAAVFYSSVKLSLLTSAGAIGGFAVSVVLSVPASYFTLHHMAMTRVSSRAIRKGDICPK